MRRDGHDSPAGSERPLSDFVNRLHAGDAAAIMARMPSESVDLVVADPPYNLGKPFGGAEGENGRALENAGDDGTGRRHRMGWAEYEEFTRRWLEQAVRLLKPTGSLYVFMGVGFIARLFLLLQESFELTFNSWIVWHYTQGVGRKRGFSPRHEDILFFTRSQDFTFDLDAVRIPQKYYRKRNNMAGANPGDVWQFSHIHYCSREREGHPTQKPEALMARMIRASSHPGDLVLDPFAGSGTSCRVAQVLERRYIGIDLNPDYIRAAEQRLARPFQGFDSADERSRREPVRSERAAIRSGAGKGAPAEGETPDLFDS